MGDIIIDLAQENQGTQGKDMNERFRQFSRRMSNTLGSSWAFSLALLVVVVWALTGPLFHFSDTWQLVINTGTTIVTFLMVFVIQNTQNRDGMAIQLKLDELLRAVSEARTGMVDLEDMSDQELKKLQEQFEKLRDQVALDRLEPDQGRRRSS